MLKFALYISNHGFGHASRMSALAGELIRFGIFVHMRSAHPDFLFRDLDPGFHSKENVITDVGVRHEKNLAPDLPATRSALLGLMSRRLEIIEREVEFLRREEIDLIVTDVPWLAVEAGTYARVPVFAVSNFDWLFIYARLFARDREMKPLLNTIFGLYQRVDHTFRLPLSSAQSMGAFRKVEKVGLLAARKSNYRDLRQEYGLAANLPLLCCTFGGAGEMEVDLKKLCAAFPGYVFSTHEVSGIPNHIRVSPETDFADLIHGSDILVTKPGYSSFAEALQFGKHIIYKPRKHYPEEDILIRGIAGYPHQTKLESLNQGKRDWQKLFPKILTPKAEKKHIPNCNARVAALLIKRFMELKYAKSKLLSVFDTGSNNLNYALCASDDPIPIHTAQVFTGLGRDYKLLTDGRVSLPAKSVAAFKRRVSELLVFDQGIASQKTAIATGIHRISASSAAISEWFAKRWDIKYRVLSARDETELAWLAARDLIPAQKNALIVDLGGFSTELIHCDKQIMINGLSLQLGLLRLRKAAREGQDIGKLVTDALAQLDLPKPEVMICIGLTATFLARIVKKEKTFTPCKLQGIKITKRELTDLKTRINSGDREIILKSSMEPQSNDILELSILFFTLMLDKFGMSEFIVSYYGISAGYNLWNKRKRI